jgi:hypothetical protein
MSKRIGTLSMLSHSLGSSADDERVRTRAVAGARREQQEGNRAASCSSSGRLTKTDARVPRLDRRFATGRRLAAA